MVRIERMTDGLWYFWDETQAETYGPYDTREEVEKAFKRYGKYLNQAEGVK